MKHLVLFFVLLLLMTGCAGMGRDPAIIARDASWFEQTDPQSFFAQERRRGVIYFIGLYDPRLGAASPVPGVPSHDLPLTQSRTWLVPSNSIADPAANRRFLEAARRFARRYNPLVLDYLQHSLPPPA